MWREYGGQPSSAIKDMVELVENFWNHTRPNLFGESSLRRRSIWKCLKKCFGVLASSVINIILVLIYLFIQRKTPLTNYKFTIKLAVYHITINNKCKI